MFFGSWIFAQNDSILTPIAVEKERFFEEKFKDTYNSNEFIYETKGRSKGWWDQFIENLEAFLKKLFNISAQKDLGHLIDLFLKILAVLIILFVVYKIVKLMLDGEGQWIFGQNTNKNILQSEDIDLNIHETDFSKLIKESIDNNQLRLAIRYYYLWLLKKLTDKKSLEWDPEKTNSDYLYELKCSGFENDFEFHSYIYDYVWYGGFDISDKVFESTEQSFKQFLKKIK